MSRSDSSVGRPFREVFFCFVAITRTPSAKQRQGGFFSRFSPGCERTGQDCVERWRTVPDNVTSWQEDVCVAKHRDTLVSQIDRFWGKTGSIPAASTFQS